MEVALLERLAVVGLVAALTLLGGSGLCFAQGPSSQPVATPASTGPVSVRVLKAQGAERSPQAGVQVTLSAVLGSGETVGEWKLTTDATGVARLDGVERKAGTSLRARAQVDGVPYEALLSPAAEGQEATGSLIIYARSGDASNIRAARLDTEIGLWEGSLHVQQEWHLVNLGDVAFDGSVGGVSGGLAIELPADIEAVHGLDDSQKELDVAGSRAVYRGSLLPGRENGIKLRLTYILKYEASRLEFRQESSFPIEDAFVVVPELPSVRGRLVEGVRLSIWNHNLLSLEQRTTDKGLKFWVGRGLQGAPGRLLRFDLDGLPIRDQSPAYLALLLALLATLWVVFRKTPARAGGAEAAALGGPQLDPSALAKLRARREELYGRLLRLERSRETAPGELSERHRLDRAELKRRLVDVERRLDL